MEDSAPRSLACAEHAAAIGDDGCPVGVAGWLPYQEPVRERLLKQAGDCRAKRGAGIPGTLCRPQWGCYTMENHPQVLPVCRWAGARRRLVSGPKEDITLITEDNKLLEVGLLAELEIQSTEEPAAYVPTNQELRVYNSTCRCWLMGRVASCSRRCASGPTTVGTPTLAPIA